MLDCLRLLRDLVVSMFKVRARLEVENIVLGTS
jgi:hypothetical protein